MKQAQLKPEVKQRVLHILKSGKYKYVRETLFRRTHKDKNGELVGEHCALGAIYNAFGVPNSKLEDKGNLVMEELPEDVRECLAPFTSDGGTVGTGVFTRNDNSNSYDSVINWIEREL
jgi:hypothetical protein